MQRALDLAAQGRGFTFPNPVVGAVLVHEDRILAEGYHHRAGEPHAEIMALRAVREADVPLLPHSTLYVTLEPCSHHGKTGPCSQAVVDCGIGRVVVAVADPNPLVSGRGIAQLRAAGCTVEVGTGAVRAEALNREFLHSMRTGLPWTVLKWAEDVHGQIDGPRTAEHPGPWAVTGAEAQIWSHRLRQTCGALLVGAGTWLADRTQGTLRAVAGTDIVRVLFAGRPLDSEAVERALSQGWQIWTPEPNEPAAAALPRLLAASGLRSLMVEGGAKTLGLFDALGLWNEAYRWTAAHALPQNGVLAPTLNADWTSLGTYGCDELHYALNVKNA
jgi:diaminohydroxyphosphoribosylaminopyrimidine deaminase/5-amino-6-(5-phosphoribosylamino)uracil reductase